MLVSKLVPLVVMGGIGLHSGGAIKDRVASAMGVADKVVTRQRMTAILDAATLAGAAGDSVDLSSQATFRNFVRHAVRVKNNSKADASLDQWGTPLKAELRGPMLALTSAGPDKKFGTTDDLKAQNNISDY